MILPWLKMDKKLINNLSLGSNNKLSHYQLSANIMTTISVLYNTVTTFLKKHEDIVEFVKFHEGYKLLYKKQLGDIVRTFFSRDVIQQRTFYLILLAVDHITRSIKDKLRVYLQITDIFTDAHLAIVLDRSNSLAKDKNFCEAFIDILYSNIRTKNPRTSSNPPDIICQFVKRLELEEYVQMEAFRKDIITTLMVFIKNCYHMLQAAIDNFVPTYDALLILCSRVEMTDDERDILTAFASGMYSFDPTDSAVLIYLAQKAEEEEENNFYRGKNLEKWVSNNKKSTLSLSESYPDYYDTYYNGIRGYNYDDSDYSYHGSPYSFHRTHRERSYPPYKPPSYTTSYKPGITYTKEMTDKKFNPIGYEMVVPDKPESLHTIISCFIAHKYFTTETEAVELLVRIMTTESDTFGFINKYEEMSLYDCYTLTALANDSKDSYEMMVAKLHKDKTLPYNFPTEVILSIFSRIFGIIIMLYTQQTLPVIIDNVLEADAKQLIIYQYTSITYYLLQPIGQTFTPIATEEEIKTKLAEIYSKTNVEQLNIMTPMVINNTDIVEV